MPTLEADTYGVPLVEQLLDFLNEALQVASSVRSSTEVEPPLTENDVDEVLSRIPSDLDGTEDRNNPVRQRHNAAIETAARGLLSGWVANTSIDAPEFVKVWNLFDILSFLSDRGQCDAALLLWLVEELLDSQTIAGCHKIFDYLESRRQRIISKNFVEKKLIILRSCNELLRRLSRAEDTAFSGRVFIFLFQSYPLGDKSSVNLRGEYHTQNVTTFTVPVTNEDDGAVKMEVDAPEDAKDGDKSQLQAKSVSFSAPVPDKPLDTEALYPIFWSLQDSFNQPKKLFDAAHFTQFKAGLESTLSAFTVMESKHKDKRSKPTEDAKRGTKRKRDSQICDNSEEDAAATFNPRYLTSRDLFDLEISDVSFRRYILVQALIIMDFLLSLTPTAKEKTSSFPNYNKSVAYIEATLTDDNDAAWVTAMKKKLSEHIADSPDGPFFLRMVETVLIRDKNWVRWKIENCPPIERPAVTAETYASVMESSKQATTNKRMRPVPMGALNLDFLKRGDDQDAAWAELKQPERYELPTLESFKAKLVGCDDDLGFAMTDRDKARGLEVKSSVTWRALRIAKRRKLALFDKIDTWEDIGAVFEQQAASIDVNGVEEESGDMNGETAQPEMAVEVES